MTQPTLPLSGNRCQCAACGEYFNSTSVFDRHRRGDYGNPASPRRCLRPEEMEARGFSKNTKGFWVRCRLQAGTIRQLEEPKGEEAAFLAPRSGSAFAAVGASRQMCSANF